MRDLKFFEFTMKLKNIRETGGVIEKSVLRMNLNYCVVPTHVDSSYGKLELIKLSSLFTTEVQVRICVIGESHLEVSARYLRLQVLDNNKFLIPTHPPQEMLLPLNKSAREDANVFTGAYDYRVFKWSNLMDALGKAEVLLLV